jgi:hypothetical protein
MVSFIQIIGDMIKEKATLIYNDMKADNGYEDNGASDEQRIRGEMYFVIENMREDYSSLNQQTVNELYEYLNINDQVIMECS